MEDHRQPGFYPAEIGRRAAVKAAPQGAGFGVLGTPLQATSYADWTEFCQRLCRQPAPHAIDFSNTQIVTWRRHSADFRASTRGFDFFVPDGMPLIWCLNAQGARLRDRVYGPIFMRHALLASPAPFTHYFLGGTEECLRRLQAAFLAENPNLQIIGARNGFFREQESQGIVDEINRLSPDFVWVGLGTPKQQAWIQRHKGDIRRGLLLAVGFAFDVNAGMKPDAPRWMQRYGLTWIFRLSSEPRRLLPRYLKFNSLFLFYLLWDGLRGRAFRKEL